MRRRRLLFVAAIGAALWLSNRSVEARQDEPPPPPPPRLSPLEESPSDPDDPTGSKLRSRIPAQSRMPIPGAPQPIPGPAGAGLPIGTMDSRTPHGLPINLATAMELAGVRPLDIATATAQVEQALAQLLQAKVLWVPNLNGGVDYFRHDGKQQNLFTGGLFQKGRQSSFVGGGPSASFALTDAIFSPLAARRVVAARRADLQAARNDALYNVTQAYYDVQAARGRILGAQASIIRADLLVNFAKGLAPSLIAPLEINRAKAELQSLRQTQQLAVRDWRVASARLAEVLLLEPSTLLEPIEPPFLQLTFVPADRSADDLMPLALNTRPEIASRKELVDAAMQLLRQEKARPLLPSVYVLSPATTSGLLAAGNTSVGANGAMGSNAARFDVEVQAVWQLQNAGFGNLGRIRQRKAEQDIAAIDLTRTVYRVKSEVSQAVARLDTARVRVVETEEEVRQAVESADKNFIGLRETTRPAGELLRLIVRPQEVVAAIQAMNVAYEQYSAAINEFNAAQFQVYRSMGQPAQWVTAQAPPGREIVPAPAPGPVIPPSGERSQGAVAPR
ncbi:TolC family protein [Singulisphaera sp. PoT]|uniref:TolC family protein n=1 Tax=Singulisphaera sp. PoT TaxID=3411797 RepID=UPI003BF5854B